MHDVAGGAVRTLPWRRGGSWTARAVACGRVVCTMAPCLNPYGKGNHADRPCGPYRHCNGFHRGIGLAIARGLAASGARVVVNGRRAPAVEQAVSAINGLGAGVPWALWAIWARQKAVRRWWRRTRNVTS
ncbi:hypothetical protein RAA17_14535 [Komagataeibacter rhaeticus]|nr:hypothetical protein [Komagataeibacter rhaeticus]